MEALLELLFEIFGETILQVVLEMLAEVGVHVTRGRARSTQSSSAWRLVIGYPLLGAIVGALSLWVMPTSLAHSHAARIATLLIAPLLAAGAAAALGALRVRRGQQPTSFDRFAYAYLFALGLAAVRFVWAH